MSCAESNNKVKKFYGEYKFDFKNSILNKSVNSDSVDFKLIVFSNKIFSIEGENVLFPVGKGKWEYHSDGLLTYLLLKYDSLKIDWYHFRHDSANIFYIQRPNNYKNKLRIELASFRKI